MLLVHLRLPHHISASAASIRAHKLHSLRTPAILLRTHPLPSTDPDPYRPRTLSKWTRSEHAALRPHWPPPGPPAPRAPAPLASTALHILHAPSHSTNSQAANPYRPRTPCRGSSGITIAGTHRRLCSVHTPPAHNHHPRASPRAIYRSQKGECSIVRSQHVQNYDGARGGEGT